MPNQLPPPGAVFLDHIAHFVPEMDPAAAALERCGFRLAPFTAQTDRVDGGSGVQSLTGLWIAAADPAEPAERFARFTARPKRRADEVTTVALDRGAVHIARPPYLSDVLGVTAAGSLPCFVAAQIAVKS